MRVKMQIQLCESLFQAFYTSWLITTWVVIGLTGRVRRYFIMSHKCSMWQSSGNHASQVVSQISCRPWWVTRTSCRPGLTCCNIILPSFYIVFTARLFRRFIWSCHHRSTTDASRLTAVLQNNHPDYRRPNLRGMFELNKKIINCASLLAMRFFFHTETNRNLRHPFNFRRRPDNRIKC